MVYNGSVILQSSSSSSSSSSCGLVVTTPHESLTTGRGGEQWNPLGYCREGCSSHESSSSSTMMLFGMLVDANEGRRQIFPVVVVVWTVGICGNTVEVDTVVVVVGVVSTTTSTSWHGGLECGTIGDDDTSSSSSSWITPSPTTHTKEGRC